jgi:hypothetical protein
MAEIIYRLDQVFAKLRKQPSTATHVDVTSALDAAIVATAQAIRNLARDVDRLGLRVRL